MSQWFRPAGSGNAEYDVSVTPGDPGWGSTGLRVATLAAGESRVVETGGCEWIVLPLSGGSFVVDVEGARHDLAGRPDVFSGPTDLVYVGRDLSLIHI